MKCSKCYGTGKLTERKQRFVGLVVCVPIFAYDDVEVICWKCKGTGEAE